MVTTHGFVRRIVEHELFTTNYHLFLHLLINFVKMVEFCLPQRYWSTFHFPDSLPLQLTFCVSLCTDKRDLFVYPIDTEYLSSHSRRRISQVFKLYYPVYVSNALLDRPSELEKHGFCKLLRIVGKEVYYKNFCILCMLMFLLINLNLYQQFYKF